MIEDIAKITEARGIQPGSPGVDVIVWVTDPQKYADDVLHHDFVVPFASHDAVTLAVLNQIDLIRPAEREPVLDSLRALLRPGDIVLVKSSNGAGLRWLGERLAAEQTTESIRPTTEESAP